MDNDHCILTIPEQIMDTQAQKICEKYGSDPTRLMDILIDIQDADGYLSQDTVDQLSRILGISIADVEQTLSFYHFFHDSPPGKYAIYLNESAVSMLKGRREVALALEKEAGCKFGSTTPDGLIGLYHTACIGMSDQEPAAIVGNVIFTNLNPETASQLIQGIRKKEDLKELAARLCGGYSLDRGPGDSVVQSNIKKRGAILDSSYTPGSSLQKAIQIGADPVIDEIRKSEVRGRGGAGFPTALKWDLCRKSPAQKRYIFCNADEGEPGTFKDRVILTEFPAMVFEGMAIAGATVGAGEGILYLRYEYRYLRKYLEGVLEDLRGKGILGVSAPGGFDIRIQLGAGAYVCGEESALIESAEGKRGEPRDRPPFPVEKGYLGYPTVVNNVETFCTVVRILEKGGDWFAALGTKESRGTKLLSVSGDCEEPGVYEVEWGFSVRDVLKLVKADDTKAVQVGGPSGQLIGEKDFDRILCYSDLATGGSLIIIGEGRDILRDVVLNFTEFFMDESCGSCVPCRTVPSFLRDRLIQIIGGQGTARNLKELEEWSSVMKMNRCGLGHTAANPVLTSLKNFPELYESLISQDDSMNPAFDLEAVTREAAMVTGRPLPGGDR